MKLAEKVLNTLDEMARLGSVDNIDFRIYPEPLGNPSIHLVHKDYEVVIKISDLSILEIKNISKSKYDFVKGKQLPKNIKDSVLKLLGNKFKGSSVDMREYLRLTWNSNNPKFEIDSSFIKW